MFKLRIFVLIGIVLFAFSYPNYSVSAKNITDSIVTDVNFKSDTTAKNGEILTEIKSDKKFVLSYEFAIPKGSNIVAGDKAVFTIPSEIRYDNIEMENVALKTAEGVVFGTATIKNGLVEITFTAEVEKGISNAYLDIWSNFNAKNITLDEKNSIPFETINGLVNKDIIINKPDVGSGSGAWLTKSGRYLGNQNPKDTLTWQIYINTFEQKKVLNDGYLIDTLGDGLTFLGSKNSDTVRVVYGPSTAEATIDEDVKVEWIGAKTFKIPLRDTDERIYITYKTKTDFSKEQYTNNAELFSKVDGSDIEESHTVLGYSEKYGAEGGGGTDPSTEQPSTEQPSTEQPSTEQPSTEQPSTEQPSTEQPSTEQPSTEQPSTEEPSTEQPSTEQPSTEQPSTEEPSTNHNTTVVDSAGTGESVVNVATPKLPATGEKSNMPLTFLIGAALIVLAFRQLANNNSQSKH
ncbi:hypothetical protein BFR42_07780 [Brochothrix thermosphacta]|uniref:Ig-like domain-containing protein n=1 Tax=Brochothrix thermosphacta TaxID=2756 RepID=UPI00083FBD9A|nr:Ig-like domain-containing protein [Brochothrix thermosphacta]ODJ54378.1 hypothetical protein BFR42_07780 [Brochothrix thermosphacta]